MKFSNSVVLVTGANRGYGRAIAREFLNRLDEKSLLLLHSRSGAVPWLQEANDSEKSRCKIEILKGDLSESIKWKELFDAKVSDSSFENAFLISNAGTCGNIEKPLLESGHMLDEMASFWTSNVAQFIPLASVFKKKFSKSKIHIINITSLISKVNVPKLSLYSASRRARNCLLEVIASEDASLRCLNWAPGPMETEMFYYMKETMIKTNTDVEMWQNMQPVKTDVSAKVFVDILAKDEYKSGEYIDLFDVWKQEEQ